MGLSDTTEPISIEDFTLEEVSRREFMALETFTKQDVRNMHMRDAYAKITNPIADDDYLNLMLRFMESKYSEKICFRRGREWDSCFVSSATSSDLRRISHLARTSRLHKNKLELVFADKDLPNDWLSIGFMDLDEKIVSYECKVPNALFLLPKIKWSGNHFNAGPRFVYGVWAPENYGNILSIKDAKVDIYKG